MELRCALQMLKSDGEGEDFIEKVHYIDQFLQKCTNQDHDALPIKLADGKVSVVSRLITGNDRMTTITTNWIEFPRHANIYEGDICAFYFRSKARCTIDDRDYLL